MRPIHDIAELMGQKKKIQWIELDRVSCFVTEDVLLVKTHWVEWSKPTQGLPKGVISCSFDLSLCFRLLYDICLCCTSA